MNIIRENCDIEFIPEDDFIFYSLECPICTLGSMFHSETYPESIVCPHCDMEYKIEYEKD